MCLQLGIKRNSKGTNPAWTQASLIQHKSQGSALEKSWISWAIATLPFLPALKRLALLYLTGNSCWSGNFELKAGFCLKCRVLPALADAAAMGSRNWRWQESKEPIPAGSSALPVLPGHPGALPEHPEPSRHPEQMGREGDFFQAPGEIT